jgi:hypothetical protein
MLYRWSNLYLLSDMNVALCPADDRAIPTGCHKNQLQLRYIEG